MSYITLRGRWFHIFILNVHAPTEDETDDLKDSFYEELERVLDKFPKYQMKILLDFNTKVDKQTKNKFRGLGSRANYTDERPPLVGEVSANFYGYRVSRGQYNGSLTQHSRFSRPESLLYLLNCTHEIECIQFLTHYF
jgi:hypothetical protein